MILLDQHFRIGSALLYNIIIFRLIQRVDNFGFLHTAAEDISTCLLLNDIAIAVSRPQHADRRFGDFEAGISC